MAFVANFRQILLGKPRDPLSPDTRHHIAMVAFLAWVGLGADGLSSSCYGPEEAFLALGSHNHLGLYLAIATAFTVFVIALAYNQVIELFPSGGGGYKVATQLLGPHAGLVSGAALIVDYTLTIAISVASGTDAFFSLLPKHFLVYKLETEIALVVLLLYLNMRGMKESIKVLLPVFLGFAFTHAFLIVYGILAHGERLPGMVMDTVTETVNFTQQMGWVFVAALFLKAYSLGGGTYTGIEAVSNNVQTLAEPRVKTGKWTMFYMALSLSFTAGGIILLYLLWDARPVDGQTLNAVVFSNIMHDWNNRHSMLVLTLAFEAGLLLVAANTGFLGGPSVLANMAVDSWMPNRFRHLSSRLVTQNGILLFGLAAMLILLWSRGDVSLLVVLYSINVFLTFSLAMLGLCKHWWQNRKIETQWWWRLLLSSWGLAITAGILAVTVVEKFTEGGWMTLLITSLVVGVCLVIRRHYDNVSRQLKAVDQLFAMPTTGQIRAVSHLDPSQPTAVFVVGRSRGVGMHALLWVMRLFPGHFKNFVFISVGVVDARNFGGDGSIKTMQHSVDETLTYFLNYCHHHGLAATCFYDYGTDPVEKLQEVAEKVAAQFPNCIFFSSKLIFVHDNWLSRLLHNDTALALQRRLHLMGMQMVILPMKL
jgi:amino acid transporter